MVLLLAAMLLNACMFDDDDNVSSPAAPLATGLQTIQSGGVEREYYLKLPADYGTVATPAALGDDTRKPLLFAYHGYTGSYENWVGKAPDYDPNTAYYDLVPTVGDEAIVIVPNGLQDASGERVWGGTKDLDFFVDILADLDLRGLQYNPNKIFVAGHSNGAGFTHELACAHGDIIRAVAVAAGALVSTDCVGSVATLMMQGNNDPLTNAGLARGSLSYWVLYNGWNEDEFGAATVGPCDDYSLVVDAKPANVPYPVLWCEHTQGHSWPDYGSAMVWSWFKGLPEVLPTPDAPPGGGSERATPPRDAYLTFQIQAPAEINRPLKGAATLRPRSYIDTPTCSAPDVILNANFSLDGQLVPGQLSEKITIPITYFTFSGGVTFPSDEWALSVTVYVEGGSTSVIPTPGVDYELATPVSLIDRNLDINIDEVLTLKPVGNPCGF